MIWKKINMNEVKYYCTNCKIEFDCLPFSYQIESIIQLFYYYGIVEFDTKDIEEFYRKLQISNPRSDGIRSPRSNQIQNALVHIKAVRNVTENHYKIHDVNTDNYALCMKEGYAKNAIM